MATYYTETSESGVTGTTDRSSDWTINGSNKSYAVSNTPDSGSMLGFVNGFLVPFTVSASTLTFAVAPVTGDIVTIVYTVTASASASSGAVTAATIIQNAMKRINVLGAGMTASTADLAFGLSELNDIIDYMRTKSHFVVYYDHAEYTFTTSAQSYSIGQDSADFTADRPIKILRANLIRTAATPDERVALKVFNMDQYADLRVPAQSGAEPVAVYYRPTFPNGTLYPWPYPEDDEDVLANKIELFTWNQLDSYSNTSTAVDLAPGYKDALTWMLCRRWAGTMGKELTRDQQSMARKSIAAIASLNTWSRPLSRDYGVPMSEDYC